jgi:hypothetical protein
MSETKEPNKEGTPSCEGCGKPATHKAILSIDVHWRELADKEGYYDGDTLVDVRTMHLCDDCDVCVKDISDMELKRLAGHFGATGHDDEDAAARREEEKQ